ncbi:MAG: twin-arginine translocation signal domain-containing protein [Pseudomonadota bacterium]
MRGTGRGRLLVALALASGVLLAGTGADACETAAPGVLFEVCQGEGRAEVLLLPDAWPPDPPTGQELIVTGAYTGTDQRADGAPAPVGLMIVEGRVVGRTIARMDGVLLIEPSTGQPRLNRRGAVRLGGQRYDLGPLESRRAFLKAAAAAGISALQSHLLVIDGRVDTRPVTGAPEAVRRIFFVKGESFGIWQSADPLTLDAAARAIARDVAPDMALNLDMGSYDFCLHRAPAAPDLACGALSAGRRLDPRLSNLLRLAVKP